MGRYRGPLVSVCVSRWSWFQDHKENIFDGASRKNFECDHWWGFGKIFCVRNCVLGDPPPHPHIRFRSGSHRWFKGKGYFTVSFFVFVFGTTTRTSLSMLDGARCHLGFFFFTPSRDYRYTFVSQGVEAISWFNNSIYFVGWDGMGLGKFKIQANFCH